MQAMLHCALFVATLTISPTAYPGTAPTNLPINFSEQSLAPAGMARYVGHLDLSKPYLHKVVFITGASSGIGAELARQFVKEGARVAMAARRVDLLDELA